ncbi:MAG: PD-(D/E)XK nuclease superfamily protein [Roseibacillus sp.]
MPRDTSTGYVHEQMVRAALEAGGYQIQEQTQVGTRPNGGKHMVDMIATRDEHSILISLKWQQVSGTAEQKIPFETICLSEALRLSHPIYDKAYIVLGREGWTLKDFYTSPDFLPHLNLSHPVEVHGTYEFIALANRQKV